MPRRKTHEEFMTEMAVKNTKVTVLGTYVNKNTKVLVKCNTCGHEWMGNPGDLLTNHGCSKCYNKRRWNNRAKTNERFIIDLANTNPNIEPLEKYVRSSVKIKFKCKACGYEFDSKPNNLLTGHGCPKCSLKGRVAKRTHSLDKVKELINKHHPNIEIISTEYRNNKTPIKFRCKDCGNEWSSRPDQMIRGEGCPICSRKAVHESLRLSHEEYVDRVQKVNPSVKVVGKYYNSQTPIEFMCKKCGKIWETKPLIITFNHSGCPQCCSSHGEKKLNGLLEKYNINFDEQHVFDGCAYIAPLKFDAYDIGNNVVYEYQGEQHYYPVNFGGCDDETAERNFKDGQIRDKIKREYCKEHGIPLIEIPYWEYGNMEEFLIDKWKELNLNIA